MPSLGLYFPLVFVHGDGEGKSKGTKRKREDGSDAEDDEEDEEGGDGDESDGFDSDGIIATPLLFG